MTKKRQDEGHTTQRTALSTGPGAPRTQSACVVVIHGEGVGKRADLDEKPVVVGRSHEADLQIRHSSVSRRHCRIWREDEGYHIHDLGSTNRTRVNGTVIEEALLADGDHITLGETILKFIGRASVEAGYHEEVYQLATRDPLTELYNRRHFMELLDKEIARSLRHARPLVLAILDLDHFKRINDRFGHIAGDAVLRRFAKVVSEAARSEDIAARIGGEEFALALPETGLECAAEFAERLRAAVAATGFEVAGQPWKVTVSIGLAALGATTADRSTLMGAADRALYGAKEAGRDRIALA
ncbi:MAG TPA: GGDEF domain-containing protein [Xanthomonadaceae bacterium]|nr:GGDEF domain-containing protein [Xanthomonadaceae bacterium]